MLFAFDLYWFYVTQLFVKKFYIKFVDANIDKESSEQKFVFKFIHKKYLIPFHPIRSNQESLIIALFSLKLKLNLILLQACTEIILPGGSNNVTDMFPNLPFSLKMRDEYCQSNLGVTPRNEWPALTVKFPFVNLELFFLSYVLIFIFQYWTEQLNLASNIIFSNGDLDPWGPGGILKDLSPSLPALTVTGGAHHLDLR